jgi:hypothetical protein
MPTRESSRTRSHVELTPLSERTWRVCDDRLGDREMQRVIGYLHRVDDEFEMLWIRPRPGAVYRYPTLEAAVTAVAARSELVAHSR